MKSIADRVFMLEQSPTDYLLYYKRATAYFSLSRHPNALDDFEKVLSLTSNSFDNALLMKAKIYAKDGRWTEAREALKVYSAKVKDDESANALLSSISEGETAAKKAVQAQKAQLWTACTDATSQALKTASHSVDIRQQRAECALASGDLEGAVADLTQVIKHVDNREHEYSFNPFDLDVSPTSHLLQPTLSCASSAFPIFSSPPTPPHVRNLLHSPFLNDVSILTPTPSLVYQRIVSSKSWTSYSPSWKTSCQMRIGAGSLPSLLGLEATKARRLRINSMKLWNQTPQESNFLDPIRLRKFHYLTP